MRPSTLLRPLVVVLVDAVALLVLSELLSGFTLDGPAAALLAAALIGLLNAFVWPVLARLALPLSDLTLGLAGLALNALLANILSGDAVHSMLTMSTVLNRRRPIGRDYSAYFARPYAVAKTFAGVIAEIGRERHAQAEQRRRDVQPRIRRSRQYAALRSFATVIQLDLQVAAVVGDMMARRPVNYTTFLAYDEVAHHSGIERPDALAVLRKVDREIARLAAAAAEAPRPYRLVVLADRGR